ncbi:MAG: 3-phosphoshikimate 1-carboxyvinyltransferase, partial [Clostridia bacterium]|nr:3-phosphoshikimate 1-carboxyvinyltransferase [Clostridia bacterium]
QGDRAMAELLRKFGAHVTENEDITVAPGTLRGQDIDMREIPDLLPPLAVVAAGSIGTTRLYNAGRCRIKECDRLAASAALLTALGGQVEERETELLIHGTGTLVGGRVEGMNDHRMVMAAALAATLCREPVTVTDSEAVAKSYPTFFNDYQRLGGVICSPRSDET